MQYKHWMLCWAFLAAGIVGCGKSPQPSGEAAKTSTQAVTASATGEQPMTPEELDQSLASVTGDPAKAVATFLDAVRQGDDAKTAAMFTPVAREKVNALGIQVAPQGSDTATFEVGAVEMLADDGARVEITWSDIDQDGNQHSDQMIWMVRKEKTGWRVAGMAATVFAGQDPVLLDFEQPEETIQKLQKLAEIRRQLEAEAAQVQQAPPDEQSDQQAQRSEDSGNSVQR